MRNTAQKMETLEEARSRYFRAIDRAKQTTVLAEASGKEIVTAYSYNT